MQTGDIVLYAEPCGNPSKHLPRDMQGATDAEKKAWMGPTSRDVPALVLSVNDDGTANLLVFYDPARDVKTQAILRNVESGAAPGKAHAIERKTVTTTVTEGGDN